MNINFKQPKYILPLILLPFIMLFFFVHQSSFVGKKPEVKQKEAIKSTVGAVSADIQKKQLEDKLAAYQNTYKEGDGLTAVNALPSEKSSDPKFNNTYSDKEKKMLDSINEQMKLKYSQRNVQSAAIGDKAMVTALQGLSKRHTPPRVEREEKIKDPMETFKQQMAYLDSMNKANDPVAKAERLRKDALLKAEKAKEAEPKLQVRKAREFALGFNTVMPDKQDSFIKVVIDENLTGYAGSRIRLRLLDDIIVGDVRVCKGTYLYALINGFSGQRVTLEVTSLLYKDKLLPVKLEIYDLDGLEGLYVPESAFRDFTKDLSTNTIQGVTIDGSGTGSAASQLITGTASKLFESASSAIAGLIRKDKAKIKYNSYLYLIDSEALQNTQKREALLSADEKN